MAEQLVINKDDLADLLKSMIPAPAPRLPRYFSFPQDIVEMLKDHKGNGPAESTVRNWKTSYGLRTTKIGSASYVAEEDWLWWTANNRELMAAAGRGRGDRLGKRNGRKSINGATP